MNFKYFLVPLMAIITISCNTKKEDVGTPVKIETPTIPADYNPEEKLKELGITLMEASAPVANYVNAVRSGNLIFLSGKGPLQSNGENIEGKVGTDLTIEEGYEAARITGINQLSVLKSELGNLNKVVRVVKVLGMVNAGPDFPDHPKVINGYSDLMVAVFGERGKHARAAVGMGSLPGNIAVEIEMIVEVMPD
ncbi:RidA family protein [Arenibacter echinorum]|uniref:Enamine deaminase RidA (YjgF/YER057c/UK114 family) n=1 Tax=Arenibacter echinorum TaxID=440515 RepID=A0A327RAN2_9FLAO|nr:RidA family protein [Arenibacter echinorum]RAJ14026.1 enamine deaminase RidA (YjgF/YER057c/UK114 family) [Arenibacter echinorum]